MEKDQRYGEQNCLRIQQSLGMEDMEEFCESGVRWLSKQRAHDILGIIEKISL